MANGYTGKTFGVDFRLPTPVRRQAVEYLRSRGFEGVAIEKVQTDAFALCWRDGGTFDLGQLRVRGAFAARTLERAFNKLGVSGLCDFAPKDHSRLCTIRLGLPVNLEYYTEPGAQFVRIEDVVASSYGAKRRTEVVKWRVVVENPSVGPLGPLLHMTPAPPANPPEEPQEIPAADIYKRFAKLRHGRTP